MDQVSDFRAPDLVFAGEAVDVRTRAADQSSLDDGGAPTGPGQVPRQVHAAVSTAKDEAFIAF
jgi:hypothetical protein